MTGAMSPASPIHRRDDLLRPSDFDERELSEFETLLHAADLAIVDMTTLRRPYQLIEAQARLQPRCSTGLHAQLSECLDPVLPGR
jgi:hypothetical protein